MTALPTGPACRICSSQPAAEVTVRGVQGLLVAWRQRVERGPFCHDCGLYFLRDLTGRTLIEGWWTVWAFAVVPFALVRNIRAARILHGLGVPQPTRHSERRPLYPGRSVFRRPTIAGALAPLVIVAAVLLVPLGGADTRAQVGGCAVLPSNDTVGQLVDCAGTHNAVITAIVNYPAECPKDAHGWARVGRSAGPARTYCLSRLP